MSQLFGRFHSDDGTPSEPETIVRLDVTGIGKVELKKAEWTIERVLPMSPGSLIEHDQKFYVLMATGWYRVDNPSAKVETADLKDYTLVIDTTGWKFSG